jgi:hypothetical protein
MMTEKSRLTIENFVDFVNILSCPSFFIYLHMLSSKFVTIVDIETRVKCSSFVDFIHCHHHVKLSELLLASFLLF